MTFQRPNAMLPRRSNAGRSGVVWIAIIGVLVVAVAIFAKRAVIDAAANNLDFALVYGASRTWLLGGNPYDNQAVDAVFLDAGGPANRAPSIRADPSLIYPPPTLAMFVPFAVWPWNVAMPLWLGANCGFLLLAVFWISRLAGFCWAGKRMVALLALSLMFLPVHTTMRFGQTPLFALALIAAGLAAHRESARGSALGLAAIIKPQIGLPFLALDALRRTWGALAWAVGVCMVIALLAILPLAWRKVPWWDNWRANVLQQQVSGQGDPTPANPMRFQLVNLQYPLHEFMNNRALVSGIVFAVVGGLAIAYFGKSIVKLFSSSKVQKGVDRDGDADSGILAASMVAVLTLMLVYHRYYDAVLLLFPLAWIIKTVARRQLIAHAAIAFVLLAPFFVNSATALYWLDNGEKIPSWIRGGWWWRKVIMPHQCWALVALACCLLSAKLASERASRA